MQAQIAAAQAQPAPAAHVQAQIAAAQAQPAPAAHVRPRLVAPQAEPAAAAHVQAQVAAAQARPAAAAHVQAQIAAAQAGPAPAAHGKASVTAVQARKADATSPHVQPAPPRPAPHVQAAVLQGKAAGAAPAGAPGAPDVINMARRETFRFAFDQPLSFDAPIVKLWTPPSPVPRVEPPVPEEPRLLFDINEQNVSRRQPQQPSSLFGIPIPKPVTSGPFREKSEFMEQLELELELERLDRERRLKLKRMTQRRKSLNSDTKKLQKLAKDAGAFERLEEPILEIWKATREADKASTLTEEKAGQVRSSMNHVLENITRYMTLDVKNPSNNEDEKVIYTRLEAHLMQHYMITRAKASVIEEIVGKLEECRQKKINQIQEIFDTRAYCNQEVKKIYEPTVGKYGIYVVTLEWVVQRRYPTLNIVPKAVQATNGDSHRRAEARRIARGTPSQLRTAPDTSRFKHIHVNGNAQDNMVVDTDHKIKIIQLKKLASAKGNAILGYVNGHISSSERQNVRSHNNLCSRQKDEKPVLVAVDSDPTLYEVET